MPRETFDLQVEVLNRTKPQTAIATAASYLAYADQTDTIGYAPAYENVTVHSRNGTPVAVDLRVSVDIVGEKHRDRFVQELEQLSRVDIIQTETVVQ